ncbi:hypothetical protein BC833DRAFT_570919, partial [Globomyces pollinis-pini]
MSLCLDIEFFMSSHKSNIGPTYTSLFPWAGFKSIHLDASIDTRNIQDPFAFDFQHCMNMPTNSTGGNGGFFVHTITTLFSKDGRFKNVKITNVLKEVKNINDPVELIKYLTKTALIHE